MDKLKRVQELRIDEFSRRRLIENQDTIDELTARIEELQNEVNCMTDSKEGRFSQDYGADQQRLQISDPHFDQFFAPATFCLLEDKIQKLRYVLIHIFYGS